MNANWRTCLYQSRAIFTQLDTFTAEASAISGNALQPTIPANMLALYGGNNARLTIKAKGYVGSTGTPTFTFTLRANTTVGTANLAGDVIGITAAITAQSGVTARLWELEHTMVLLTQSQTDAASFQCLGQIESPGGFAAPYKYGISPTADTFTAGTATLDLSVAHYINLSVTCGTSNAANLVKVMDVSMFWEN